jgi:hypothetical protein
MPSPEGASSIAAAILAVSALSDLAGGRFDRSKHASRSWIPIPIGRARSGSARDAHATAALQAQSRVTMPLPRQRGLT